MTFEKVYKHVPFNRRVLTIYNNRDAALSAGAIIEWFEDKNIYFYADIENERIGLKPTESESGYKVSDTNGFHITARPIVEPFDIEVTERVYIPLEKDPESSYIVGDVSDLI